MLSTLTNRPCAGVGAPLLEVRDLAIRFTGRTGPVTAVADVSFSLGRRRILGIVGESGSGKTQILLAMMGLLAERGKAAGSVLFEGRNLLTMSERSLGRLRGDAVSMIFQDPMTSLNPYMTIGRQLTEVLARHGGLGGAQARRKAIEMLDRVGIPDAARRAGLHPHEFSGGMRQRVMIAMALLCRPRLLLADEPTTALDATVQAQILDLLAELSREMEMSIVLVTHDLGVVARLCDEMLVLYGGRTMEHGPVDALFHAPRHPYTAGLLAATPRLDLPARGGELVTIAGQPRAGGSALPGCPFAPRCPRSDDRCRRDLPRMEEEARFACYHPLAPGERP